MDIKNNLLDEYIYRFELHAHSYPVSSCSEFSCSELVESLVDDGLHGVALTNHLDPAKLTQFPSRTTLAKCYLKDFYDTKRLAGDRLSVCLGVELRFCENGNDYLVYGVDEDDIEKFVSYMKKGIDVFYREIKNDKNIILQAHPFRSGMVLANPESIDGIEVFNFHSGHNSKVSKAAKYARDNNMLISGGLDLHHEWQRGQLAVRCKHLPKDSYDVAELIKSQDFIFEIGKSIILP